MTVATTTRPIGTGSAASARALKVTGVLYIAGFVIHSADHFARGLALTPPATFWLGTISLPVGVAIVVLAMRGHRLAPALAVFTGISTAVAASMIHVPPYWSVFSEPFRAGVTIVDWLTLVAMVGTAVAFAVTGALMLRSR